MTSTWNEQNTIDVDSFWFKMDDSNRQSEIALHRRHNDHDDVSNHQPHGGLLNRLLKRRSKKTSKLRVTGLCVRNSAGPVNSPHKGPVTRKMFPFDDVIMESSRQLVSLIYNSRFYHERFGKLKKPILHFDNDHFTFSFDNKRCILIWCLTNAFNKMLI